jgi:hypothetical protein
LTNDDLRVSFDAALPDWQPGKEAGHVLAAHPDVVGSPYCVRGYVADDHLGDEARSPAPGRRSARDMGLILDFVPNHVAPDHPLTASKPELSVRR